MADEKQKKDAKKAGGEKSRRRKKPAAKKAAGRKKRRRKKPPRRKPAKKPGRRRKPQRKSRAKPKKASPPSRNRPRSSSAPAPATCGCRRARRGWSPTRSAACTSSTPARCSQFSPRGAAQDIRKLIESAASNAENNHDLVADEMKVVEITVDEGPTLRRFRPRALGRATRINKRTSHIAVALSPEGEEF